MNARISSLSLLSSLLFATVFALPSVFAQDSPTPATSASKTADWMKLKEGYDYDSHKSAEITTEVKENSAEYVEHLEFKGLSGEKVTGLFVRPKKEGVYPLIVMLHGWTSNKDDMDKFIGPELIKQGFAFFSLDAPDHGERKPAKQPVFSPELWSRIHSEGIKDYRYSLGWVLKRKDVDKKHVGLLGYSMGSMMGAILASVEPRIQCAVLCVGGDIIQPNLDKFPAFKAKGDLMSPSLYIGHISPRPLLMLNGTQDPTVNKAASDLLYANAKNPRDQKLYDCGHLLPKEAIVDGVTWLSEKMKSSDKKAN